MVKSILRKIESDVFIIGGGPAGLVAGIAATRKGFKVVLADSAQPPIDKACGEGLMPDAILALHRIGLHLPEESGMPFTGIRFIGNGRTAESRFPRGVGLGIRRTRLHDLLVREALAAGVSIQWGTTVQRSADGTLTAAGVPVRSRWVIGADGQKSRVREWANIRCRGEEKVRYGFRRHYAVPPTSEFVEVNWGRSCQAIVTPVGRSEICVAVMTHEPSGGFDATLSHFPDLEKRLKNAPLSSISRGGLSVHRKLEDVASGKYVLVGDASGSVDAITGEGLSLAFQESECLAEALYNNDLDIYRKGHRRIRRIASMMAQMMLLMGGSKSVGNTVLRVFESCPGIFAAFLATHLRMNPGEGQSEARIPTLFTNTQSAGKL